MSHLISYQYSDLKHYIWSGYVVIPTSMSHLLAELINLWSIFLKSTYSYFHN
uniref:Uncharacterized protein n=1 Tax=Arundo donax TaxID=35708 RepID=A0A0A9A9T4_ARUDO